MLFHLILSPCLIKDGQGRYLMVGQGCLYLTGKVINGMSGGPNSHGFIIIKVKENLLAQKDGEEKGHNDTFVLLNEQPTNRSNQY